MGKIEGRRRRVRQRMRWLDGITYSMDMGLCELREFGYGQEAWHAAVHGDAKSRTQLSNCTKLNWSIHSCDGQKSCTHIHIVCLLLISLFVLHIPVGLVICILGRPRECIPLVQLSWGNGLFMKNKHLKDRAEKTFYRLHWFEKEIYLKALLAETTESVIFLRRNSLAAFHPGFIFLFKQSYILTVALIYHF